jgi:uncharacterized membrane protein YtjA (UPF0391 family)
MLKIAVVFLVLAVTSLLMRAAGLGPAFDIVAVITFFLSTILALAYAVLGLLERGQD